jgi:hypothetical protein
MRAHNAQQVPGAAEWDDFPRTKIIGKSNPDLNASGSGDGLPRAVPSLRSRVKFEQGAARVPVPLAGAPAIRLETGAVTRERDCRTARLTASCSRLFRCRSGRICLHCIMPRVSPMWNILTRSLALCALIFLLASPALSAEPRDCCWQCRLSGRPLANSRK